MKNYLWQRYWHKIQENPYSFDGFLLHYGKYETISFPFDKFSQIHCLVLLGEPGMGKSNEIERIFNNQVEDENNVKLYRNLNSIPDATYLNNKIFESEKVKTWKKGHNNLYLYLDSLDEALVNINTLSGLLACEIGELPVERLFLRVACRSTEWSNFSKLDNKLKELWKDESFQILQLAPLTNQDVIKAAQTEGLDGEKFLKEIVEKQVTPLAAKPITLKLLLNIFREKSEFPSNQSELYERGCLALCDEDYEDKPASREKDELTAEQRLKISARIASLMIFSNKSSIWIGKDTGEHNNADILISELTDYFEKNKDSSKFRVTEKNISETIRKGLFKGDGNYRIKFSHQTFVEFLAARYLDYQEVSDETLIQIIGEKYLHPQLYETSAWIASRRITIFQHLMKIAPTVLLRSDVLAIDDSLRGNLAEKLLEVFDNEEARDDGFREYYTKLKNSKLAEQLQPYLIDKTKGWLVRRVATDIAEACETVELQNVLADIALDKDDIHATRVNAAYALMRIGDSQAKKRLMPLVYGNYGNDENLELKGVAITSLWKEQLSTEELFKVLESPPPNFLGSYTSFIYQLGNKLELEDLPVALKWLKEKATNEGYLPYELSHFASELMSLAWQHLDNDEILENYANVILPYLKLQREGMVNLKDDGLEDVDKLSLEKRRKVLIKLLPLLNERKDWARLRFSQFLRFRLDDTDWLVEEWLNSKDSKLKSKIIVLLRDFIGSTQHYFSTGAPAIFLDKICQTYKSNEEFKKELNDFFEPIELDSIEAEQSRKRYKEYLEQMKELNDLEESNEPLTPSGKERVIECLTKFEQGEIDFWWRLNLEMTIRPNSRYYENELESDLTKLSGWIEADNEIRLRIVETAKKYLIEGKPHNEKWIGTNTVHRPAFAGYRAFKLLIQFDPKFIQSLERKIWEKWLPIIYFYPIYNGSGEATYNLHKKLLAQVHQIIPDKFPELLIQQIKNEITKESPHLSLDKLELCWDDSLKEVLRKNLVDYSLPDSIHTQIFTQLFELNDENIEMYACNLIKTPIPEDEKAQRFLLISAGLLLEFGKTNCWDKIWEILIKDVEFGKKIVEQTSFRKGTKELSESRLGDLYLWLSEHYPKREDPDFSGEKMAHFVGTREEIGNWRDSIIDILKYKGTAESISEIERIMKKLPKLEWLKFTLIDAKERFKEKNWQPFTIQELFTMLFIERSKNVIMTDKTKLPTKISVLFFAANPYDQPQLALDEEIRLIQEKLRASDYRDSVDLKSRWAVRPPDLLQALNEVKPNIIHFSGHGTDEDELVLKDNSGNTRYVSRDAIVKMLSSTGDNIQVVVFNTCFSHDQAKAITEYIDIAIGMNDSISDEAARIFAAQFYSSIGFGYSIEKAFNQAIAALMLEGISEEDIPQLCCKEGINPNNIILIKPYSGEKTISPKDEEIGIIKDVLFKANGTLKLANEILVENQEIITHYLQNSEDRLIVSRAIIKLYQIQRNRNQFILWQTYFENVLDKVLDDEPQKVIEALAEIVGKLRNILYAKFDGILNERLSDFDESEINKHLLGKIFIKADVTNEELVKVAEDYLDKLRKCIDGLGSAVGKLEAILLKL